MKLILKCMQCSHIDPTQIEKTLDEDNELFCDGIKDLEKFLHYHNTHIKVEIARGRARNHTPQGEEQTNNEKTNKQAKSI